MLSKEYTGSLSDISNTAISLRTRNTAGETASKLINEQKKTVGLVWWLTCCY
jgi:hypothetical protein